MEGLNVETCDLQPLNFQSFNRRILKLFALFGITLGNLARQTADAAEEGLTFGNADRAARIEDVEQMRTLEHVIMRGDDEPLLEAGIGFGGGEIVHRADAFDIGGLEIIFGVFELLLTADLAVGHARAVFLVPDGARVVERDQDAFEPVGDLNRDGVERHAAHLLEVGELRDLLPVEPDLPTQTPGGDGGLFPVVLHKADVVLARIDAERFERLEIQLLRIAWVGLENDLKLGMQLEAVGVLAVAPVIGADRRLDVTDVPRFGSEHAQEGVGIHRPCADLGVVRLGDQASVRCPEVL